MRVNRDDLRRMLFDQANGLSYAQEGEVTRAQHAAVTSALRAGKDAIVDDTNLRAKFVKRLMELGAEAGADVVFHDIEVDLRTALFRDSTRQYPVGERVVRDYFERFTRAGKLPLVPEISSEAKARWVSYIPDLELPDAFIFDIDGTLAHIDDGGRSPYDMTRVSEDYPDETVADVLVALSTSNDIVLVSGRNECARDDTVSWLNEHSIPFNALYMRADEDGRGDDVVKHEILHGQIAPRWHVRGVFDDRARVVAMWR
ncbi:MAG: hypothetical protein B7X41_15355, partial [Microbacterium sp. 14-71-5]